MYQKVLSYFNQIPGFQDWPQFEHTVNKIINDKPKHILIPGLIGQAFGVSQAALDPGTACLFLLFSAVILVDDFLDGDQRFSENTMEMARLSNIAGAMIALAYKIMLEAYGNSSQLLFGVASISDLLTRVAFGQALDVLNPSTESEYWRMVRLKSGSFFSGAFALGGIAMGLDSQNLAVLKELGETYGILIQLHDDLRDCLQVPANPDWRNGRFPLPILYAHLVDHEYREVFERVRHQVDIPGNLRAAQEILVRCGAISYGLDQIRKYHERGCRLLQCLNCADPVPIERLLDELVNPVESLLDTLVRVPS